jgi:hypothetical protein
MTRSPDHHWTAPPPGAAPLLVCAKCGASKRPPMSSEPCDYTRSISPAPARATDYDPHNLER